MPSAAACALCAAFVALLAAAASAAPTPAERQDAAAWTRAHLAGPAAAAPFSFTYGGNPSRRAMAGWKATRTVRRIDAQRTALTLTWQEQPTGLRVRMEAVAYPASAALEWTLHLTNTGAADTPIIEGLQALDAALTGARGGALTLHRSLGDSNSADSFRPVAEPIPTGDGLGFAPVGGRSSDGHMPFFNVQAGSGGAALAIGWSGQWAARIRNQAGVAHATAGMELTHLRLHAGEEIRTPRILLVFWRGADPLRGAQMLRRTLFDFNTPRRNGEVVFAPICGSVGEVDPDGSYEGPHIRVMKPLAQRGVEVFWSDMDPQQWYPGGFPAGTGTWEPDLAKYPRGLKPVGDAARAAGLGYLLWFEPERVAAGTQIAREHPEWVAGGAGGGLFRLDLPEARRWITDKIDTQIALAGLDWIRWDFNIQPLGYWRGCDAPDRQGMTEIRHIEGLYAMWDELAKRHPGQLIDLCASGGRRLDIEALRRGLPLWHSDLQCEGAHPEADQLQNAGLYRWLPLHACGLFGLEPSYAFRSAATTGNVLCLAAHAPENEAGVRRSVEVQKKLRPYVLGDFYDTLPHTAEASRWFAYQFHRADLDAGYVIAYRRAACAEEQELRLRGLRPIGRYEVTFEDTGERRTLTGAALANLRVSAREAPGSALVTYRKAPAR